MIGLGVMMGRALAGGFRAAERIARSLSNGWGNAVKRALAITGYIVSIPIFVDSAFVILIRWRKRRRKAVSVRYLTKCWASRWRGLVVTTIRYLTPPAGGSRDLTSTSAQCYLTPGWRWRCPGVTVLCSMRSADKRYPDFVRVR
ncbi:hypothetical protein KCP70_05795 [Salmonella enterica subsp. enterica]|nr:hypothetical protein KCP70_05795 [Salmonella enterica subsp. enterica]